ncbi:MAG: cytochrome c oxidase subunit 3 [Gemmatimonadota bacterium]
MTTITGGVVSDSVAPAHASHGAVMEPSPFLISSKKLTMWLFIVADAATFGGLLFGYGYLRFGSPNWTKPFTFSPNIINGLAMTVILLTSSLTMLGGVAAAREGRRDATMKWLGATVLLGVLFATLHLREWSAMLHDGWSLTANPMGGSVLVGAMFFSITGLHLLHVISGVVAIIVIAIGFQTERLTAGHVETTGLYWHFVDLVWMFVFPLMYLLNVH